MFYDFICYKYYGFVMVVFVVMEFNNWYGVFRYVFILFIVLVLLIYDIKLCFVEVVGIGCLFDLLIMLKILYVVCYYSKCIGVVNVLYFIYRYG